MLLILNLNLLTVKWFIYDTFQQLLQLQISVCVWVYFIVLVNITKSCKIMMFGKTIKMDNNGKLSAYEFER